MLNLITKPFRVLKNNLIFIQPLLLLLLIVLTALSYTLGGKALSAPKIILLLSLFLLTAAFSAGWFYINKSGVLNYDEKDTKEEITLKSVQNFKKFFEGVGAGFLNVLLSFAAIFILYTLAFYFLSKILVIYAGIPQFIYKLPQIINSDSQNELMAFVGGIPEQEKLAFTLWVFSITILTAILNYCSAVYFAALTFDKKNIFKTFWSTIKFIFKNIPETFFIIIFLEFLYFFLNLLSALAGANTIAFIILIILFTMYFNYCLLLVFCFYYDKTKVDSNNRGELLGQDEAGD